MMMALISTEPSAASLRGRAISGLVMTGFGALWIISAAEVMKKLDWRAWMAVTVFSFALCVGAVRQFQRARHLPSTSQQSAAQKAMGLRIRRQFGMVLAFEWLPIFGAIFILNRIGRPELIVPAIALIVGLHFIPLAAIFGARLYYLTAGAMIVTTLSAFAISTQVSRQGTICAGCGVILWITAALLLV